MSQELFTGQDLPEYHEGMLILRIESPDAPIWGMATGLEEPDEGPISPAWLALSRLERAGLIKRVMALSPPSDEELGGRAGPGMLGALGVPPPTPDDDPNAGVSIIELERDSDVEEVQMTLADEPGVEYVSRVPVRYLHQEGIRVLAEPPPASQMWNLQKIRWSTARALPEYKEASRIKVAVLDSGIDDEHPDLKRLVKKCAWKHPEPDGLSSNKDIIGHGTHVAGTIAAQINNDVGINGICECRLYIWKIFDDRPDYNRTRNEFCYYVDQVMYRRALIDCSQEKVDVVNLSIGGRGKPDHNELKLFNRLLAGGTIVVAAMGNERRDNSPTSYPAAIPGVIAVGATRRNDTFASFSNAGNHISLCAPGEDIWSALPTYPGQKGFRAIKGPDGRPRQGQPHRRDTDYGAWYGTSMASPHVAAAVALLLANKGPMDAARARKKLMATADRVSAMRGRDWDPDYGAGRLNLHRLLSE